MAIRVGITGASRSVVISYRWDGAADGSSSVRLVDGAQTVRNYVPNPKGALSLDGYTGGLSTGTSDFSVFRITSNPEGGVGTNAGISRVTALVSAAYMENRYSGVPIIPGVTYTIQAFARSSNTTLSGTLFAVFTAADGTPMTAPNVSGLVFGTAFGASPYSYSVVAPAGAAYIAIYMRATGSVAVNDTLDMTYLMLTQGSAPIPYFDGSTASTSSTVQNLAGAYDGIQTDLVSYSSSEDATPIEPSASSGGVGQISFTAMDDADGGMGSLMLLDNIINVSDGANGTTVGTITGLSASSGQVQVTADSRLGALLATRTALPQNDIAANIFKYYLSLGGITDNIIVDVSLSGTEGSSTALDNTTVMAVPGWTGVIWDNLRAWAVSINAEVSLVSNNVVLRPLRRRTALNKRDSTVTWNATKGSLARTVEVNYYNNEYHAVWPAYPIGGWNTDVQIYQVDAGETLEVNVPVDASHTSVEQPIATDYVGPDSTASEYCVIGADGLAIKTAQWVKNGGSVKTAVGEDGQSIDITIVGATTTQGPFRIAAGSGASDAYSSLRIRGTGTFFTQRTLTLPTGVADSQTPQVVGVTVDNPFISSVQQAYRLGLRTAGLYGGNDQTITVDTIGINRADDSGSTVFPTFADFVTGVNGKTTAWSGKTFADFNAAWPAPKTFDDFTTLYYQIVQSDFNNQAFGNVAGARVKYRDAFYRISSATISPESVSYEASRDTTFFDFNNTWVVKDYESSGSAQNPAISGQLTFEKFNTMMAGRTFDAFSVTPLWRKYYGLSGLRPNYSPVVG